MVTMPGRQHIDGELHCTLGYKNDPLFFPVKGRSAETFTFSPLQNTLLKSSQFRMFSKSFLKEK